MGGDPSKPGTRRIRCYTRAVKNAHYLKQQDPATFDRDKEAEGFGTGVPLHILHRLHHLQPDAPELEAHPHVSEFLKRDSVPKPQKWERER